ncbi:MAG: class I SAM-dependent methyltransferase [Synechococcaceae cyanobacterium SM2_3_1]|nr:class I SAM-dependent methyltransferase [Synechococcaceae cyanobacterium SM2_3_1]
MATILRTWSYHYPWLYQAIARTTAALVGGFDRLHQLPLQGLEMKPQDQVLDLCCGRGEATQYLAQYSQQVTGLDASPKALAVARKAVPNATFVEGWAQDLPFANASFDLVHSSLALHELTPEVLDQTLREVHRVLKPEGIFTALDFHRPTQPWLWPGLSVFFWLFETETAWQLLETDLATLFEKIGFNNCQQSFYVGGFLQVIQAQIPEQK